MIYSARKQLFAFFGKFKLMVKNNPWVFLLCVVFSFWISYTLVITQRANRLGFGIKTLWDWLELLIVPIVIAFGGLWFNLSQRKTELEIADRNREEDKILAAERMDLERELAREKDQITILDSYLDRMNNLLLSYELRNSDHRDEVRTIARARTIATLINLDAKRREQVLQFLIEAGLIKNDETIVFLEKADFSGMSFKKQVWGNICFQGVNLSSCDFSQTKFFYTSFQEASLRNANLQECEFRECSFNFTDFEGANLSKTNLSQSILISANLSHANLTEANLSGIDLSGSNPLKGNVALLRNACLMGATLDGAHLFSADLSGAKLNDATLKEVKYNELTIWPEGYDPIAAGAILIKETYSRFRLS